MKALILSGGGALGAFEAGAIKALNDNGYQFDLVCGTSIGAINAAFVAQGKFNELASLWQNISTYDVITYVEQVQHAMNFVDAVEKVAHLDIPAIVSAVERWMEIGSKKSLLALRGAVDPAPIKQILAENLDFDKLQRSLIVTATNLTYGSSEAFYAFVGEDCNKYQAAFERSYGKIAHNLSAIEFQLAVRASAAIPGFFEPVPMNYGAAGEKDYVDGGVANNTPVQLAAMAGATEIVVIMLQPELAPGDVYATTTLPEIALASYTVMQQQFLYLDSEIVKQKGGISVYTIRPSAPLALGLLGFDNQPAINVALQQGQNAVNGMAIFRKQA